MTRTLLIGMPGLTWPPLGAAMRDGLTPRLSKLAAEGAIGPLHNPQPRAALAFWTTVMTGVTFDRHGLWRSEEAWAGGVRASGQSSWRVAPLWERFEAAGLATASVGWPGACPGAAWSGRQVDDTAAIATGPDGEDWALPRRCAPEPLREALRPLRVHPADISGDMLLPLVPRLAEVDQERDPRLARLAVAMARAATTHAAACHLAARRDWTLLAMVQPWLGDVLPISSAMKAPFEAVTAGAWRFADALVGRLLDLVGDAAAAIIVAPGDGGAAGAILGGGAGVAGGVAIEAADALDLAPTLLARAGLADATLPGRILPALAPAHGLAPAPIAGVPLRHEPEPVPEGYRAAPGPSAAWRAKGERQLAGMLLAAQPARAEAAADRALALRPGDPASLALKAAALVAQNRPEPLPAIADALDRASPGGVTAALVRGGYHALRGQASAARPYLRAVEAAGEPELLLRAGAAWLMLGISGDAARVFGALLDRQPGRPEAEIGLSIAAMQMHDLQAAEAPLRRVLARDPAHGPAWLQLVRVLEAAGRGHEADRARGTAGRLGAREVSPA